MADKPTVLLAEDDASVRKIVAGLLGDAGLDVEVAADGQDALDRFAARAQRGAAPDVVLSDINMPRLDGLALLDRLKALDPEVLVIFVTAYSSVDSAVGALRKGAYDYIGKPFRNDQLVQVVRNAVTQRGLFRENRVLRREVERTYGFTEIVGRSPGMGALLRVIERAAPTAASILIRGETGTGKEVVARAVHHASPRAGRPFVSINCAALPEGLLESELFGHEKGSFSGAVARSLGLFRAAHGGTLFLDEVGEMPAALQAKLLRVLEAREVRPVGSTESIAVDVRIVAATHRDLEAEVKAGRFREDLYYRFAVIEVTVPPLRDRPDDIPLLARHFLRKLARERAEPERKLSPETLARFVDYPWPGNVRELLNAIEHAATLGEETIGIGDLPARLRGWAGGGIGAPAAPMAGAPAAPTAGMAAGEPADAKNSSVSHANITNDTLTEQAPNGAGFLPAPVSASPAPSPALPPVPAPLSPLDPALTLAELERRHVLGTLARLDNDRKRAADALGIDLSTLYRKLKRWEEEGAA